MTTKHCEECGTTTQLQQVLGHTFCIPCLKTAQSGKQATKQARQLRLDPKVLEETVLPATPAPTFREDIEYHQVRKQARQEAIQQHANFRANYPWIHPGMVVVNLSTGDLAIVRSSTNPDIEWHLVYLTHSIEPQQHNSHPITAPQPLDPPKLRIGDQDEYAEARQLLADWPKQARQGIHISPFTPATQELWYKQVTKYLATTQ